MKTHISVDTKIKVGLIGFGRMGPGTGKEIISRIEDTGKRTGNVR